MMFSYYYYIHDHEIPFRYGLYYVKWFGAYPRLAISVCFIGLLLTRLIGHSSQWVWASVFIISAALRAMDILTLSK